MTISDENHLTPVGNMLCNSVLKKTSQVTEAKTRLKALNLFLPHDSVKAWDTYKIIEIINNADRESFILDVGCNDSHFAHLELIQESLWLRSGPEAKMQHEYRIFVLQERVQTNSRYA
jgi:hypothetical protein